MIGFIKKLFGFGPTVNDQITDSVTQAPYKVETPVAKELPAFPVTTSEKATEVAVKSVAKPAPKKASAPKKPGAPKKASGNRPRKPKAPK